MENSYIVKLYRSKTFKIVHGILAVLLLFSLIGVLFITIRGIIDYGFYDYFFSADGLFLGSMKDDMAFPIGICSIITLIVEIALEIFLIYCLGNMIFNNKMLVSDKYIVVTFLPFRFFKVRNKSEIISISRITTDDISVIDRLVNYNFENKYLYRIKFRYFDYIISSDGEDGINKLTESIIESTAKSANNSEAIKDVNDSLNDLRTKYEL